MKRKVLTLIIFVFMLSVISAAYAKGVSKEVKVVISVDKNRVEVGSHIRLTVGVEGAFDTDIPELSMPESFSSPSLYIYAEPRLPSKGAYCIYI